MFITEIMKLNEKEKRELMKKRACGFLDRYLSEEIKGKIQNGSISEADLLRYIVHSKAWIAMTRYERFSGGGAVAANRASIENKLISELTNNLTGIIKDFDKWHDDMCRDTLGGMRYGLWQKLINITFKYIYALYLCRGYFKEFEKIFCDLHCPVDRIISEKLLDISAELGGILPASESALLSDLVNSRRGGWNNISPGDYKTFQNAVERICKKLGICPKLGADVIFF